MEDIQKIEVNSKEMGNYLWLFYEENEVGISLDGLGNQDLCASYFYPSHPNQQDKNNGNGDKNDLEEWEII